MKRVLVQFLLVLLNFTLSVGENTNSDTLTWRGDLTQYTISADHEQIQLTAEPQGKEAMIYSASAINSGTWRFRCKMAFNPSTQNYLEVWLTASDTILSQANGMVISIGRTNDRIDLVQIKEGERETVASSSDNLLNKSEINLLIEITRSDNGVWSILADLGEGLNQIASSSAQPVMESRYFIIRSQYTSTRSDKIFFNELSIKGKVVDIVPIIETPIRRHDILFTEFMVDPSPTVNLPEEEYVEIYNRSENSIALNKLTLQVHGELYPLPNDTLYAGEVLLLSSNVLLQRADFRNVRFGGFPSLSNSGFTIYLQRADGCVIDGFKYDPLDWDSFKCEGGWSLERETIQLSFSLSNWHFSESLDGGTPGVFYSNPKIDQNQPKIRSLVYDTDSTLNIILDREMSADLSKLHLVTQPVLGIKESRFLDSLHLEMQVKWQTAIDSSVIYTITDALNFRDADSTEVSLYTPLYFGKPAIPKPSDLWINEIMFDPIEEDGEYIELFNSSNRIVETTYLRLQYGEGELRKISPQTKNIFPNEHCLILKTNSSLIKNLNKESNAALLEMTDFPQLSNTGGSLKLKLANGTLIDSVSFSPKMHQPTISNSKGVSLERGIYQLPFDPKWFSSASSLANYATPGVKNSFQMMGNGETNSGEISLSSPYFSPNNDGYLDRLVLTNDDALEDGIFTISIYSKDGYLIKTLLNNKIMYSGEMLFWDGTDESGNMVSFDLYLVLITGFSPNGERYDKKMAVAVVP